MNLNNLRSYYEVQLNKIVHKLRSELPDCEGVKTAVVLGTGWADAFALKVEGSVPMSTLGNPLNEIGEVKGHSRCYEIGTVNHHRVIVLRGRVHMNESTFNPNIKLAVRAQIEAMLNLGVRNLILTAGVGSLKENIYAGNVVVINGWISSWSEEMPLFPGEFVNPEETIDPFITQRLVTEGRDDEPKLMVGSHIFWRGSHFEGRKHDKDRMRDALGDCVGMSVKPECCIAALDVYKDAGVRTIPLGFVTNGPKEEMLHEHHRDVARQAAPNLAKLLERTIDIANS